MLKMQLLVGGAVVLVLGGCSEGVPTGPSSAGRAPTAPAFDRNSPSFAFTPIDVPGAISTNPQGINARGDVAGWYVDAQKHFHGFILQEGNITTIDYSGAEYTDVRGIGPDGTVVGTFANSGEEVVAFHGFKRYPDGTTERVHFPRHLYEIPQRILADGTILGCRHDHDLMGSMHGIMITRDDSSDIGALASMNNGATPSGKLVAGLTTDMMTGQTMGYTIDDGVFTTFMVPGSSFTTAWDVSPRGDVVGVYRNATGLHGYVRTASGFTTVDVPVLGASATRAFGTNARGDVVGTYLLNGTTHGFVMTRQ